MLTYAPDLDMVFGRWSRGPVSVSELGKWLAAVLHQLQVRGTGGQIRPGKRGRSRARESRSADRRAVVGRSMNRLGGYLAATADQPDTPKDAPQ